MGSRVRRPGPRAGDCPRSVLGVGLPVTKKVPFSDSIDRIDPQALPGYADQSGPLDFLEIRHHAEGIFNSVASC
jgi:hypothetical protein